MTGKNAIPIAKNQDSLIEQFEAYYQVVKILRKECPWDSKQTNESIANLLIEESYETIEAIHKKDDEEFSKELGDLLLHIVMHAIMAEERGAFNMIEVIKKSMKKLIHRHPHVFANVSVDGENDVLQNWEALKMQEKGRDSILQGVPIAMPSLLRAQRIQHKVANVGFDWDNKKECWDKVEEEFKELKTELLNGNSKNANMELGDLLFSIVNAARKEDIVAEEALQFTNDKFTKRFQFIEKKVASMNKNIKDLSLEELDIIWDEAKSEEKKLI